MEARIARLESDVGHMRSDLSEVKVDIRTLRDKMDLLSVTLLDKLDVRIDAVNRRIDDVKDSITAAEVWALILYAALAAGVFSTMAQGFGWI